ncbi:c-di-GMP-binding flagellar brake protein YcgR, contains PilZNR and PilZ domains [Paenibacillus sp. UNCCL117]|uniref:flagellar brake protein n=1 Tax=unclassified Paenibacillus TaxID=185978 RepID=UPI00088418D8|nr:MULTISPECIES: flagellar brake domain-containing protein [unclassified Paenibacillus]SDC39605.1 c-di-GMP-binding flagellar brake protein YcgR, contains PilZNR and PilZ domains [Paenibacillus sp. cl123]SFW14052.1 c-di-GMP-binding flagellar brake protein YcgR, contains PilZNR and PilZ domains [Paenibacillus sp. UNCCL117]
MLPKVNSILHIQVNSIDEEEARQEYKSRIADVTEDHISMEVPLHEASGRLKRLYPGDELSIYFITDGGVKNYFSSSVIGFNDDVIRLVQIKKPAAESITKIQRRNFLRVPAEVDIAVRLSDNYQFVAMTDDVGGGGISFVCEGHIPVRNAQAVGCWLLLPFKNGTIEHVPFKSEVVRVKPLETGRQQVMLRFSEIAESDRQKVIRYCFERQFDFRKK